MIKKIIAALLAVTLLTACGSNNGDNKKNINGNKNVEESAGDDSGDELDKRQNKNQDNQQDTQTGEDAEVEKQQDKHSDDTHQDNFKKEKIEISEERFSLFDLFDETFGATYMYSGSKGFKKVEKFLGVNREYETNYYNYEFVEINYNNMENGQPRSYNKKYSVKQSDYEYITEGERNGFVIKERNAVEKREWLGYSRSQLYGVICVQSLVTKWDEDVLVIKIKAIPGNTAKKVPYGYEEEITFHKGRGVTSINVKNGENEEVEHIVVTKMSESMMKAHQAKLWKEIPQEYVKATNGVNGYFEVDKGFFNKLNQELKSKVDYATSENQKKLFKEYLKKMPDYSLNAVGNIIKMADIMYKTTKDDWYLIEGIKEYERRITAIDDMHAEEVFSVIKLNPDIYFNFQELTGKYIGLNYLLDEEEEKINRYRENFIGINPEYGTTKTFGPSKSFVNEFEKYDIPEDFRAFLKFKGLSYGNKEENYNENTKILVDAMTVVEGAINRDKCYEEVLENMMKELVRPIIIEGKLTNKYIARLDYYISKGPMTQYFDDISNIKKLIDENRIYTDRINNYLRKLADISMDESANREIDKKIKKMEEEREYYKRLKKKYKDVIEIDTSKAVKVWTVDEFLRAIKDDALIMVMEDMHINTDNRSITFNVRVNEEGVFIDGVENLTIIGNGDYPVKIQVDSYGDVFNIQNCKRVRLRNLSFGHKREECIGPVIRVINSNQIQLENSIIYGCGFVGLRYKNAKNIEVANTLIWDCQNLAIDFENVKWGSLRNVFITKNGINEPSLVNCTKIKKYDVEIGDELYD